MDMSKITVQIGSHCRRCVEDYGLDLHRTISTRCWQRAGGEIESHQHVGGPTRWKHKGVGTLVGVSERSG